MCCARQRKRLDPNRTGTSWHSVIQKRKQAWSSSACSGLDKLSSQSDPGRRCLLRASAALINCSSVLDFASINAQCKPGCCLWCTSQYAKQSRRLQTPLYFLYVPSSNFGKSGRIITRFSCLAMITIIGLWQDMKLFTRYKSKILTSPCSINILVYSIKRSNEARRNSRRRSSAGWSGRAISLVVVVKS